MDTAEAEANSPMRLSPPRPAAMSVLVGGAETAEFNRQSEEFAAAWQDRMVTTEVQATPGDHHFSIIENMTIPESPVTATLRRHLGLG